MYVSPFHDVSGRYEISVTAPGENLAVSITLHRDGARPFTASLSGTAVPQGSRPIRSVFAPLLTTLLIRIQGVGLWMRRLKVRPRPVHPRQKRSEEHTTEIPSLMRISYAVFCLKKTTTI